MSATVPAAVLLDTMIYDKLLADAVAGEAFRSPDRPFRVLATHLQVDQVKDLGTPDDKRGMLLALLDFTETVQTAGAVWDASRWNQATWGTDE